jgi:translation initiation factor 2B subunit (eIF-2B alpha/beta/delta family)
MNLPASLQQIVDDNLSGSVTLLKRLMIALENELLNPELDPATFINYIEYFRYKMEMFTVLRHFCDELILSHNISVSHYPANYLKFIDDYKQFWEHMPQLLTNNLVEAINLKNTKVILHSNSGTIREVFRLLSGQSLNINVVQTLSAPAEEGRIQAHDLAEMGYKVTLIADVLAAGKLKSCDYLILAADQVRSKTIVNKVGSMGMVLAAQEFNVPVIVLTESRKLNNVSEDDTFRDKKRDPAEILHEIVHPNIAAENSYFEEIPRYMISKIITEKRIVENK